MNDSNAQLAQAVPGPPAPAEVEPEKVRQVLDLSCGRGLLAHAFDPSGRYSVTAGMNTQLTQVAVGWGGLSGPLHFGAHKTWIGALAFHPGGKQLFSSDYTGLVCAWAFPVTDAAATPAWTQQAHQGWIRAVAVSPDGALVATCGNDQLIKLWSTADGAPQGELRGHESHVYNVAFHPAGQLVSGDLFGVIKQWDVAKKEVVRELDAKRLFVQQQNLRLGGVRAMAFDAAGTRFAAAGMSGFGSIGDGIGVATVVIFDWASGLATHVMYPKEALRSFTQFVAFHPAGFVIGGSGGLDQGVLLYWKPETPPAPAAVAAAPAATAPAATPPAETKPAEPPKPLDQHTYTHFKLPSSGWGGSLHPDGQHIAIAHHDGALRYYEM